MTLERPTRVQSAPGVLPIVRVVFAFAATAPGMTVGMAAQLIVRKCVDGPDNRVIGNCSPPNKSLS